MDVTISALSVGRALFCLYDLEGVTYMAVNYNKLLNIDMKKEGSRAESDFSSDFETVMRENSHENGNLYCSSLPDIRYYGVNTRKQITPWR